MGLVGIDLSMTSPALCVFNGKSFSFADCSFHFLTEKEKYLFKHNKLHGELFPEYSCDSERFNNIAAWVVDICLTHKVTSAFIEGYSYGSVGRVFQIAENGGIVKHALWKNNIAIGVIPPKTIKKHATGNGNADKQLMEDCFKQETHLDIKKALEMTVKQWNPSSDIIDSYYACKYGSSNDAI